MTLLPGSVRTDEVKQKHSTNFVGLLQLHLDAWRVVPFHTALEVPYPARILKSPDTMRSPSVDASRES